MKITEHKIKVSELCQNYRDDGDGEGDEPSPPSRDSGNSILAELSLSPHTFKEAVHVKTLAFYR